MDTAADGRLGVGRQSWNFAQHFLEMCIPMCAIGTPLTLLAFVWGPAALGYADPRQYWPELSLVVVAFFYTLPMVGWMRFRGMAWRPTIEMSTATMAVAVVLIGLTWAGRLSLTSLREFAAPAFCGPACGVMLLAMLPRLDLYTGRSGHHMHMDHDAHSAQLNVH